MSGTLGSYTLTVNASASFNGNQAPIYELLVNGTIEATGTITSNSVESQSYTVSAPEGQANTISIAYINHTSSAQLLTVQSVQVNGTTISTASAGEDYVSSNGTYYQWGQMYFGGEINIPVPAADFPVTAASGSGSSGSGSSGGGSTGSGGSSSSGGSTGSSGSSGAGGSTSGTPPSGTTAFTIGVNANASFNGSDYPIFDVLVDGQQIGTGTVNSNNIETFSFTADLVAGATHEVQIVYTNHDSSAQLLTVQSISVGGQTISSSSSGETYVSPNGTQNQTGQMYFGGTLDFNLPAVDFGTPASSGGSSSGGSTSGGGTGTGTGTGGGTTPPAAKAVYISPNGSDSNSGTESSPFATLNAALQAMQSSGIHTVYLESGTYSFGSTTQIGSTFNGDTIAAAPGASPVLDATNGNASVLLVNGVSGMTISGLTFENASANGSEAALTLYGSSGNTISGNIFRNNGEGALFEGGSSNNVFTLNELDNSASSAVEIKDGSNSNTFSDNLVNGTGAIGTSGGGFYGHGISNDTFANNLIENTAGIGIGIEDFGQGNTVNQGNTISGNVLTNISTSAASQDTGAIYLLGRSDNNLMTTVSLNFISGVGNVSSSAHAEGIYLDDNSSGVTISNNIIQGVQSDDIEVHAGSSVTITNNILNLGASTRTAVLWQQPQSDQYPPNAPPLSNDRFTGNIITSQQSSPLNVYAYFDTPTLPVTISGNLYWDPANSGSGLPMASNAFDSHPVVGNPAFVSPSSGNYALGAGSAAGVVGFSAINQSAIGLLAQPA